ncbi:alpha/beta fold hydrolase [Antrihabitans stalactiti]|uniref:Alpha/beta hydrolase n=1 Tax=Antrihabitans stalactiti TaxID=2584121 RepID=A0A848KG15_9NOCA|nr:alpha/beta hydrolase [Antrihabitans stalactiti]NMN95150.1 alpha/beta hydrolase [Antrihabitans stalactiti]
MASTGQYDHARRSRAACVLEFLVLAGGAALIALAVAVWAIYGLLQVMSLSSLVWWAIGVVLLGGGIFLAGWFGVLEYWDGRPWRELADKGRAGQTETVRTADGAKLHVEVEGPANAQTTVVFVHGIQMNASSWRFQRAALADSSVRRVSYDARGHGKSDARKLDQKVRGVRQLAEDLGLVIDATARTGRLVLCGHSMGGLTVLALPVVRPDLALRTSGYVLCSATPDRLGTTMTFGLWRILSPVSWLMRREAAGFLLVLDALPRFVPRLMGLAPYLLSLRYFAIGKRGSKKALRTTASIVYANGFRQTGDLVAAILDHDERPTLAALGDAHVAVIEGAKDRIVPARDRNFIGSLPDATLTTVDKCGHMTILEAKDEVNAELLRIVTAVESESVGAGPNIVMSKNDAATETNEPMTPAYKSTGGSIIDSLGDLVETVEGMTPAGPIRDGLHGIHKLLGVQHENH